MNDPARAFAILASIGGVLIALAMPPSAAPDESRHLSRVFLMSEGFWRVPGTVPPRASVPKSIPELYRAIEGPDHRHPPRHTPGEIAALAATPLDAERRVGIANAGTYPPVAYLPSLLGVAPARWLDLAPAALIWAGRFTSLAVWIALTALAIRLAPARRWTLALLSLTPTALASAASVSADPVTGAAALLWTALVMRSACGEGPLTRTELRDLFGAALLLGLAKPGYAPLLLGALAIPAARFGGRGWQGALVAALAAALLVPMLGWAAHASAQAPVPPLPDADLRAQLAGVLADPLGFAGVLWRTLAVHGASYWTTFVAQLGPLVVELPAAAYALFTLLLAATVALDGPPPAALASPRRAWLVLAFAGVFLAVELFAYLGWNPVGAPLVNGVQGRYFAPALPMLVFALPAARAPLPRRAREALVAGVAIILLVTLVEIARVYYRW